MLFVCTANQCRSPMAAALLRADLAGRPGAPDVGSAGFVSEGMAAPPDAVAAIGAQVPRRSTTRPVTGAGRRVDETMAAHRSRRLTPSMLASAALIVTMTRAHLLDLVVMQPGAWARSFTFAELLRRAVPVGPRRPGESIPGWVARLQGGRSRSGLVALPVEEDVEDPMGGRRRDFDRTAAELGAMTATLADLLCPPSPATPSPATPSP